MFYVTAGRGTERFVEHEIRRKFSTHSLSFPNEEMTRDGKIFFTFDEDLSFNVQELFELKTVERIFVAIANYKNTEIFKGKKLFLDKLMDEVAHQENYFFAQHVLKQLMSLSSNVQNEMFASKLKESESGIKPVSKKARLQLQTEVYDNDTDNSVSLKHGLPEKCDNQFDSCSQDSSSGQKNTHESDCNSCGETLVHKISFRLSIRCSGQIRKWLSFKKLSQDLSWRVVKATGWIVDLRSPMYEICLHISDHFVTIGIPLTRRPLSCRTYILDPGLRGPIAWIMAKLAEIQPGDMVLDPMCGKGTLLLESCSELQEVIYMGVDNDGQQLTSALRNAKSAGFENQIHFLQANALSLPLKTSRVNAIVCDVPFNQKYFISLNEHKFFSLFLSEMMRVLQEDGNLVLLTSEVQSEKVICVSQETRQKSIEGSSASMLISHNYPNKDKNSCLSPDYVSLNLISKQNVKLGETLATIIVLKKKFTE